MQLELTMGGHVMKRTEINMFGDGELLQCVTTDGAYITVSHVINLTK